MKRLRSSFPEFLFVAFHEIGQPVDIVQFNERDALCAGDSFRQGGFATVPSHVYAAAKRGVQRHGVHALRIRLGIYKDFTPRNASNSLGKTITR